MTADDFLKALFGAVLTAVMAVLAWVVKRTIDSREETLVTEGRVKFLEVEMADLKKTQITTECVRDVIEEVLDRRDAASLLRREEQIKLHQLEMRHVISEELEKAIPRIVREIEGRGLQ